MNTQLASLTQSLRGNQVLDGAALIGRTVVAQGDKVYLDTAAARPRGVARRGRRAHGHRRSCSSSSRTRAARTSRPRRSTRQPACAASRGTARTTPAQRAPRRGGYKVAVLANVGGKNESLKTSIAAGVRASRSIRPPAALMLDTDALGEIAMSDVERVL